MALGKVMAKDDLFISGPVSVSVEGRRKRKGERLVEW